MTSKEVLMAENSIEETFYPASEVVGDPLLGAIDERGTARSWLTSHKPSLENLREWVFGAGRAQPTETRRPLSLRIVGQSYRRSRPMLRLTCARTGRFSSCRCAKPTTSMIL